VDCPNCHFQIGDESQVCPFCTFVIPAKRPGAAAPGEPLSFEELTPPLRPGPQEAPAAVPTEVEPIRPRKQSGALLYFLAAAAVGGFAYFRLSSKPALRPAMQSPAPPLAQVKRRAPTAAEAVDARPAEAPAAQKPKPAEPPPAPVAPAPAPPPPPPATYWEFEGQVYDILTLKPVPGVEMTFYSDEGNQQTKSGETGRFKMRLPALKSGGYRLVADHPDYSDEYFDDAGAGFRKMPLKQRASLRNSSPNNLPWTAQSPGSVRRDVVLFPLVPDR